MCSIIGSLQKDIFKELVELNKPRGTFSYSITILDKKHNIIEIIKDFGEMNLSIIDKYPDNEYYFLGHQQAPTNSLVKIIDRIHPANINDYYLYHNGVITNKGMDLLKQKINLQDIDINLSNWDTYLLLKLIVESDESLSESLSHIIGGYACIMLNGKHFNLFRNASSIIYFDTNFNISSTKFESGIEAEPGAIYEIRLYENTIKIINWFEDQDSNFIFL